MCKCIEKCLLPGEKLHLIGSNDFKNKELFFISIIFVNLLCHKRVSKDNN